MADTLGGLCEVMDMPRATCAHCRPADERRRLDAMVAELTRRSGNNAPRRDAERPTRAGPVWRAQYAGRCEADCGERIEEGDEIVRHGGAWAHLECVD